MKKITVTSLKYEKHSLEHFYFDIKNVSSRINKNTNSQNENI